MQLEQRLSNYIWLIGKFIGYYSAAYILSLMVTQTTYQYQTEHGSP